MFSTLDQVREYLSGDKIRCLVCGKNLRRLQHKHLAMHDLDADSYRERYGIPWTFSLTSAPSRQATSVKFGEAQRRGLLSKPGARGKVGLKPRKRCPAVKQQWSIDSELGREVNARRRVTVPCSGGCGTQLETTVLTAVQPIYCDLCASPSALKQRRRYYRLYPRAS